MSGIQSISNSLHFDNQTPLSSPQNTEKDAFLTQSNYQDNTTQRSHQQSMLPHQGFGVNPLHGDYPFSESRQKENSNTRAYKLLDLGMELAAQSNVSAEQYPEKIRTETENVFKMALDKILASATDKSSSAQISRVEETLLQAETLVYFKYPETEDYVLSSQAERQDYLSEIQTIRLQTYINRRDLFTTQARAQALEGNISSTDMLLMTLQKIYYARYPEETGSFIFDESTRNGFATVAVEIRSLYSDQAGNRTRKQVVLEIEALYKEARNFAIKGDSTEVDERLSKIFEKLRTQHPALEDAKIFSAAELDIYTMLSVTLRRQAYDIKIQIRLSQLLDYKNKSYGADAADLGAVVINKYLEARHLETNQPVFDEATQAQYRNYVDQIKRSSRQQPPIEQVYQIAKTWAEMGDIEATNAVLLSTAILYNATYTSTETGQESFTYTDMQRSHYQKENIRIRRQAYNGAFIKALPEAESAALIGNTIGVKKLTTPCTQYIRDTHPENGSAIYTIEEQTSLSRKIDDIESLLEQVRSQIMEAANQ
jgi:hypothetical protein